MQLYNCSKKVFVFYTKVLMILSLAFAVHSQAVQAQTSKADSVASSSSILIMKDNLDLTIYDYGQTRMELTFLEYLAPNGNLYFSEISLEVPGSSTSVYLTLDQTRRFLNKLNGIYQIDEYKDVNRYWKEQKTYFFSISTQNNRQINFKLEAAPDGHAETTSASGNVGGVSFNINNFEENLERSEKVLSRLIEIANEKENDLAAQMIENQEGISGYKIDYQKFYENGLSVYKSEIHETKNLRILSDQKISREQRRILVTEFSGQYGNYSIVYDEHLNFYAEEEISIPSFTSEIVSLVKQYSGEGILDLKIYREGDRIYSTFSIVKSQYERVEDKSKGS